MDRGVVVNLQASRVTTTLLSSISFLVPLVWGLSTGLVWDIGKRLHGSVSDTSISFPSGIPLVLVILVSWLVSFLVVRRFVDSMLRATLLANAASILALGICFTIQFGATEWHPVPSPGLTNIFPMRFMFAALLAFACSVLAGVYMTRRAGSQHHEI